MSKPYIFILLSVFFLLCSFESPAQRRTGSADPDNRRYEENRWSDRLWIGSGFILPRLFGLNGQTNISLGITPQIGVRIFDNNPNFSIGPRFGLIYSYQRFFNPYIGEQDALQPISYSVGAFARYKILNRFFPQIEYEVQSSAFREDNGRAIVVGREQRQNFYGGVGYNTGNGDIGYEMMLLYNFNHPDNAVNTPFDFRVGLTYKF